MPGISGSIGNGILGEYFPEREYTLLNPKRTRKRPKFQPCPWPLLFLRLCLYTISLYTIMQYDLHTWHVLRSLNRQHSCTYQQLRCLQGLYSLAGPYNTMFMMFIYRANFFFDGGFRTACVRNVFNVCCQLLPYGVTSYRGFYFPTMDKNFVGKNTRNTETADIAAVECGCGWD